MLTLPMEIKKKKKKINKREKISTWVIPENSYNFYNENKKCLEKSSLGFIELKTLQK